MQKFLLTASVCVSLGFGISPALAGSISDSELVSLQVTMQSHIDATLVEGAMLSMDAASGNVMHYYPTKAHPKVMTMGDNFIMCAEMVDENGNNSMANFYIARAGAKFMVFQTTVGSDPILEKLMKDGRVAMAN